MRHVGGAGGGGLSASRQYLLGPGRWIPDGLLPASPADVAGRAAVGVFGRVVLVVCMRIFGGCRRPGKALGCGGVVLLRRWATCGPWDLGFLLVRDRVSRAVLIKTVVFTTIILLRALIAV